MRTITGISLILTVVAVASSTSLPTPEVGHHPPINGPPPSTPTCSSGSPCLLWPPWVTATISKPSNGSACGGTWLDASTNKSWGLTLDDQGGYINPGLVGGCTYSEEAYIGFYSPSFIAGSSPLLIKPSWSYTGQFYILVDCTYGGDGLGYVNVFAKFNVWNVSSSKWMLSSPVSASGVSGQLSGCATGHKITWTKFVTVSVVAPSAIVALGVGYTYQVWSYFDIHSDGLSLPTGHPAIYGGVGSCAGLDSVNKGSSCTGNSTSGAVFNNLTLG